MQFIYNCSVLQKTEARQHCSKFSYVFVKWNSEFVVFSVFVRPRFSNSPVPGTLRKMSFYAWILYSKFFNCGVSLMIPGISIIFKNKRHVR
jgi:hypothetical protein